MFLSGYDSPAPPCRSKYRFRIDNLRSTSAQVKFLSLEPLLGPLTNLDLADVDWVIVGGESGPGARPMEPTWATDLRDQCHRASVPFFFKQWGGKNKKQTGRILDGRTWDQMPAPSSSGSRRERSSKPLIVVGAG